MNIKEIESTIYELENGETTYQKCQKLANLYVVKDHLTIKPVMHGQSGAYEQNAPQEISSQVVRHGRSGDHDSPFLKKVREIPPDEAWGLMDEVMETLKIIHPRLYNGVFRRLEENTEREIL